MLALTLNLDLALVLKVVGAILVIGAVASLWLPKATDKKTQPSDDKTPPEPSDDFDYQSPDAVADAWTAVTYLETWAKSQTPPHSAVLPPLAEVRQKLFIADINKTTKKT